MAETKKIEGAEQLMTPANIVTMVRIVCIPIFILIILGPWPQWVAWEGAQLWKPVIAAIAFVLLSVTDTLDGYLARSRGEVTDLGKFMDPLADKILVAAAMLALVELGALPSWIAMVILAREFIVSGIRMVAASKAVVIAASWNGKAKTVFQMVALTLFIVMDAPLVYQNLPISHEVLVGFSWILMSIAVILTFVSMVDYFVKSKDLLGFGKQAADSDSKSQDASVSADGECEFPDCELLNGKAAAVIAAAAEKGVRIGTAESCTGGMIAAALTSVPGASNVLEGTVVSYSNNVKNQVLGVSAQTLESFGAVSRETACEMSAGVRDRLSCDVAVSVTGIAGPTGAVPGKPVGTVWIGVSTPAGVTAELHCFQGNREQVRIQSACAALDALAAAL